MALGSTQPLVKMSTRNIPEGKGSRCVRLTTYYHTVPLSRNLGALTSLNTLGPARPWMGELYRYLLYLSISTCFARICVHHQEKKTVFMRNLVLVILCGRLSGTQGGIKLSYRYCCFSWWWAHSRPKHVEKRNRHNKKNCTPSWLYL